MGYYNEDSEGSYTFMDDKKNKKITELPEDTDILFMINSEGYFTSSTLEPLQGFNLSFLRISHNSHVQSLKGLPSSVEKLHLYNVGIASLEHCSKNLKWATLWHLPELESLNFLPEKMKLLSIAGCEKLSSYNKRIMCLCRQGTNFIRKLKL